MNCNSQLITPSSGKEKRGDRFGCGNVNASDHFDLYPGSFLLSSDYLPQFFERKQVPATFDVKRNFITRSQQHNIAGNNFLGRNPRFLTKRMGFKRLYETLRERTTNPQKITRQKNYWISFCISVFCNHFFVRRIPSSKSILG
jgi:hypothetical protein